MYAYDGAGDLLWLSREMELLLGDAHHVLEDRPGDAWLTLLHPEDRDRVAAEWHDALARGVPHESEYRLRRPNGTYVRVRCVETIQRADSGEPQSRVGVLLSVSEEREPDRAVRLALGQQRAVAQLGQLALRGTASADLFEEAVEVVQSQLEVEFAGILAVQDDGGLVLCAGRGWPPEAAVGLMRVPSGPGTHTGAILLSEEPVIVGDMLEESPFRFSDEVIAMGVRSGIGIRIQARAEVYGLLGALSLRRRRFSADESAFLQAIANIVGASLSLERSESERDAAISALLRTEDEERARIAIELHDDTVQVLAASLFSLDRQSARAGESGRDDLAQGIQSTRGILTNAMERARRLMFELRPPLLHTAGAVAAVQQLVDELASERGFSGEVTGDLGRLDEETELLIYRTAAELVLNAAKHAGAQRVTVRLSRAGALVHGAVEDDGGGFDLQQQRSHPASTHIGLDSTSERLRLADGELTVESTPGSGTRAAFVIPIRGAV
jgi:signal transduction histidine kinase